MVCVDRGDTAKGAGTHHHVGVDCPRAEQVICVYEKRCLNQCLTRIDILLPSPSRTLTAALARACGLEGRRGDDQQVALVVQGHVGTEEGVLADVRALWGVGDLGGGGWLVDLDGVVCTMHPQLQRMQQQGRSSQIRVPSLPPPLPSFLPAAAWWR